MFLSVIYLCYPMTNSRSLDFTLLMFLVDFLRTVNIGRLPHATLLIVMCHTCVVYSETLAVLLIMSLRSIFRMLVNPRGLFNYYIGLTLIPAGLRKHRHYKVWYESTYLFPNFSGFTVEVWGWKNNFKPAFYYVCDYISMLESKIIQVRKKCPRGVFPNYVLYAAK